MKKIGLTVIITVILTVIITLVIFELMNENTSAKIYFSDSEVIVYTEGGQVYQHGGGAKFNFYEKNVDGEGITIAGVSTSGNSFITYHFANDVVVIDVGDSKAVDANRLVGKKGGALYKVAEAIDRAYDDTH